MRVSIGRWFIEIDVTWEEATFIGFALFFGMVFLIRGS